MSISIKEIEIKSKYLNTPWITTKGIRKSSKRKQRFYEKYLKLRSKENEKTCKTYKNLFKRIKKNAKKNYHPDRIKLFENDIRNTRKIMKEIIGKKKCNNETLPKHLIVDKIEIHDAKSIAEKFNEFFVNIGPNLARKIPQCNLTFKSYFPTVNTILKETVLRKYEFEEAFKTLKRNKALGHDGLDENIITSVHEFIKNHC